MIKLVSSRLSRWPELGHLTTVVAKLPKGCRTRAVVADVARLLTSSAPRDTFHVLVVLVGNLTAAHFVRAWDELPDHDATFAAFTERLRSAEVMAGRHNASSCTRAPLLAK